MNRLQDDIRNTGAFPSAKTQVLNLEPNVAGTAAYVPFFIGLVCSIIWVATEPKSNKFVRFHALQSLCLTVAGIAVCVLSSILGMVIGALGSILSSAVSIGLLVAGVVCMVQAWKGQMFKLPVLGDIAADKL